MVPDSGPRVWAHLQHHPLQQIWISRNQVLEWLMSFLKVDQSLGNWSEGFSNYLMKEKKQRQQQQHLISTSSFPLRSHHTTLHNKRVWAAAGPTRFTQNQTPGCVTDTDSLGSGPRVSHAIDLCSQTWQQQKHKTVPVPVPEPLVVVLHRYSRVFGSGLLNQKQYQEPRVVLWTVCIFTVVPRYRTTICVHFYQTPGCSTSNDHFVVPLQELQ